MSDRGRENNGIASMHTAIQHQLDPSLHNTLQHRWCINKMNIKAEAGWSQFRSQWAPGFEDLLDFGVNTGIYSPSDPLEKYESHLYVSCPILYSIVYVTVWYFVGSLCHGSKPKLINGFRRITLAQDEQTGTKSSPRVYRISSMQNLNGLDQRIFKLSRKLSFIYLLWHILMVLVDCSIRNV